MSKSKAMPKAAPRVKAGKKKWQGWMVPGALARKLFFLERKNFLRRFRVLALAGLPYSDALEELRDSAYRRKNGIMFAALESMVLRQRKGRTLAETFDGWLAPEDVMLIEAGDLRGGGKHLAEAIDEALEMHETEKEMKTTVLSGLFEPFVMLAAVYGLIAWMASNFVTEVLTIMNVDPAQLKGTARQLYEVGIFATSYWAWLAPILLIVFGVLVFMTLPGMEIKTKSGAVKRLMTSKNFRGFLDRYLPPWSVYAKMVGARWLLSFAKLSAAGYPHEDIMQKTARLASPWLKERIQALERVYRKGIPLGRSFERTGYRFPSDDVIEDIAVFADRPEFDKALQTIAKEWVKTVTSQVKMLAFALTAAGFLATTVSMLWIMDAFNEVQNQVTAASQQKL